MIETDTNGDVAVVRMNRTDARNALTPEMLDELAQSFEKAAHASAIVLEGAGPSFCAGFDLKLCQADPAGGVMRALLTGLDRVIRSMRAAPCPVVLAAQGAAIAGGCALLGGADIVVTDRAAKLGYPVARIGVSPAVSAPFLAPQTTMGFARSRMLDPGLITGAEAFKRGLAHELVDERDEVQPRAHQIASKLAAKPRSGLHATKGWMNTLTDSGVDGLAVSQSLVGGKEERRMLAAALGGKS